MTDNSQSDKDWHVMCSITDALSAMYAGKPGDHSDKDRRYAVTITELEKVFAYFDTWVARDRYDRLREHTGTERLVSGYQTSANLSGISATQGGPVG